MKIKLTILVALTSVVLSFSQSQEHKHNSGKRIVIENPSQEIINELLSAGIDLRCGAIYTNEGLQLELTSRELNNLDKKGVDYKVKIEELTKFYADRAAKDLPIAQAQLKAEKAKNKMQKKQNSSLKLTTSIFNVTLDNPLQYYGEAEVNWAAPANFVYGSMGGCLTVSEMEAQLDLMKTLYPTLITTKKSASPDSVTEDADHAKTTYGFAGSGGWLGQTVYFVKISDGILLDDSVIDDTDDNSEPDILYTSMIHSRELSSLMGNIYFMWYLLENYANDPAVKNLIDNNELFFVPVVNPDGLKWNEKEDPSGGGMNRTNLRGFSTSDPTNNSNYQENYGVDPNRNFNYLWGTAGLSSGSSGNYRSSTYRGPTAFSEPETQIMRDFILSKDFKSAVWQHSSANAIPHPYGGIPTKLSGREDEMAKWHEDMTRYNRYVYGAQVLSPANGIADDWMLGGEVDGNGSLGSGMNILATTPENGDYNGSEGGFWPSIPQIIPIAKRMMRINFMNAYYGGKYAKFHDLTQSNIPDLSSTSYTGDLTFGIERIGQTASDFTLTITPISSNIVSITSPLEQKGMNVLEQKNVTASIELNASIQPNDKIEYKVTLSNDSFVFYEAEFEKYYNPTDLNDLDNLSNWTSIGNWASSTTVFPGLFGNSIKGGDVVAPYAAYSNSISSTLTTTNPYDLSGSNKILVQFYAKWDLERNFDYVEIEGYNGTSWVKLNGKYNKPESSSFTNSARRSYSSIKNSYLNSQAASSGLVYDGDQMDNWVLEEIVIDAANNSTLLNTANAKFRFKFVTDGNNNGEVNYSTTYDGFYFDDFKIIEIPCSVSVPTNLASSSITNTGATLNWDDISSVDYDLRYKETGSSTWTDVLNIALNTYNLTGLTPLTEYEVQVRAKCDGLNSNYSSSITFTTLATPPCTGTVFSDFATGYSEDFNSGLGFWTNPDGGWTSHYGTTPSNTTTGPSTDADGGTSNLNRYLYTESSNGENPGFNGTTYLESPCFDLSGYKDAQFSFSYHWYGANIITASLIVEVSSDNDISYANLFTKPTGESSIDSWQNTGFLDLSSYNGEIIKIRLTGNTGDGFRSDMALDNFNLTAVIDASLGIEDEILSTFQLYPNPVIDGEIKLKIPREITDFNVTISNVFGQKVYENSVNNNYETAHIINSSKLKSGIYFVTVSTNLGKATKKLIIQE